MSETQAHGAAGAALTVDSSPSLPTHSAVSARALAGDGYRVGGIVRPQLACLGPAMPRDGHGARTAVRGGRRGDRCAGPLDCGGSCTCPLDLWTAEAAVPALWTCGLRRQL